MQRNAIFLERLSATIVVTLSRIPRRQLPTQLSLFPEPVQSLHNCIAYSVLAHPFGHYGTPLRFQQTPLCNRMLGSPIRPRRQRRTVRTDDAQQFSKLVYRGTSDL